VRGAERAVEFYRDALRLTLVASGPARAKMTLGEPVRGEFQFMRQWESKIRRCSVAASDMTEGLRLDERLRRCVERA
jgi:hypothetical protein